jgi:hypothetical protein
LTCETRPVCEDHYLHRLRKTAAAKSPRRSFFALRIPSVQLPVFRSSRSPPRGNATI